MIVWLGMLGGLGGNSGLVRTRHSRLCMTLRRMNGCCWGICTPGMLLAARGQRRGSEGMFTVTAARIIVTCCGFFIVSCTGCPELGFGAGRV